MIISDLNHVEVVSQETETTIEGGYYDPWYPGYPYYYGPSSSAYSGAGASAYGWSSYSSTYTGTYTTPGYSSSSSSSSSNSSGGGWYGGWY